MIYQCYFKEDQRKQLFKSKPYKRFGLEPEVNPNLFLNCPELESKETRLQLVEYGALLWHWRNFSESSWIGFTSYRQLVKSTFVFSSVSHVDDLIKTHPVVGWGQYFMMDQKGNPISLKTQAEVCHPGINEFIEEILGSLPDEWSDMNSGFFANYWVMTKELFFDFMEYSWPLVKSALEKIENSNFYRTQNQYGTVSKDKCVGYVLERLFIFWYISRNILPFNSTKVHPLFHQV